MIKVWGPSPLSWTACGGSARIARIAPTIASETIVVSRLFLRMPTSLRCEQGGVNREV